MIESKLLIYSILGISLNINPDNFGLSDENEYTHLLVGEYFFKDILTDGKLLVNQSQINQILKGAILRVNAIHEDIIYVQLNSKLPLIEYRAEYLFTENPGDDPEEDDDEEYDIFKLL